MKFRNKVAIPLIACSLGLVTALSPVSPVSAAVTGGPVLALAPGNQLLGFNVASPTVITQTTPITGLVAGETVVGFDVRPATGQLYAIGVGGTSGHVYTLNPSNGVATVVNATAFSTTLPVGGTWSVDFNPVVDRIRFVHSGGSSLRINQLNGTLVATDTAVAPAAPAAVAYDRSTPATPTLTTLFTIDAAASTLNLIGGVDGTPSPNGGATTLRGPLGVTVTPASTVGFDVGAGGDAVATLSVAGVYGLYNISLATGAATSAGTVGLGATAVLDIALPRPPVGAILALSSNNLLTFDAANPAVITSTRAITGLQAGESIVGFDMRPATGEVFAIGVAGTSGRVYKLNPATGAVTLIGTAPFSTTLPAGGTWAVDFNPVVDRIRFVHSTGASFRVNQITGALAGTDTSVAPAKPTAVAYDRNIATTAATTLYAIDDVASTLNIIGGPDGTPSPNTGATTLRGDLGVLLDSANVGFEIVSTDRALATFSSAGLTGFYTVDLASGQSYVIGNVGAGTTAITDITVVPVLPTGASQYTPVTPARLLDTREGGATKPGTDTTLEVQVTGAGGVPANATAVVLNVTGTEANQDGFITVFPSGAGRPLASNNNLTTGGTKASLASVGIGANGRVNIYVQHGAHIVVDVFGYYAPPTGTAGRFTAVTPGRAYDSRTVSTTKPAAATTVEVDVTGRFGVPETGVSAVIVNLTIDDATLPGYVRAWASGAVKPATSNLNVQRTGGTVANLAVVPVGANGNISVETQLGGNLIVDVAGWFCDSTGRGGFGGLFVSLTPNRILDTREGLGAPAAALIQNGSIDVAVGGQGGIPATASAAFLNVTAVNVVAPGFVTVYPVGDPAPAAAVSNLNADIAGQIMPNAVAIKLGTAGRVTMLSQAGGHLVADASGWFTS